MNIFYKWSMILICSWIGSISVCSSSSQKGWQSCSAGVWEDLLPRAGGAKGKLLAEKLQQQYTLCCQFFLGSASSNKCRLQSCKKSTLYEGNTFETKSFNIELFIQMNKQFGCYSFWCRWVLLLHSQVFLLFCSYQLEHAKKAPSTQ